MVLFGGIWGFVGVAATRCYLGFGRMRLKSAAKKTDSMSRKTCRLRSRRCRGPFHHIRRLQHRARRRVPGCMTVLSSCPPIGAGSRAFFVNTDGGATIACAVCGLFADAIALRVDSENVAEVRTALAVSSPLQQPGTS